MSMDNKLSRRSLMAAGGLAGLGVVSIPGNTVLGGASMADTLQGGTDYTCDFTNSTPDVWTFCVYQTLPSSVGLQSIAWKQGTAAQGGDTGVQWSINYMACLANYKQSTGKGVYKSTQKLATNLGSTWDVITANNIQQLKSTGPAPQPNQVIIANNSGDMAAPGIGMDGDMALVQPNVYSGSSAQFVVEPVYWVGMFKDLVQGEVISSNVVVGPLQVKFAAGKTSMKFTASLSGGVLSLQQDGGSSVSAPMDQVYRRIKAIETLTR